MKKIIITLFVVPLLIIGCGKPSNENKTSEIKSSEAPQTTTAKTTLEASAKEKKESAASKFKFFYVYSDKGSRDNHYVPSGFMPNGNCIQMKDDWMDQCYEGKTCIRFAYDVECSRKDQKWGGVYWLSPANNWGQRKGGYNLTGAQRLTFWARGENGGEQIQEMTVGGIAGNYPDSDISVLGPIILSKEWRQYTVDLRGKDLSHISGGLAWTTSEEVNSSMCVFYIDEIRFE